MTKHHLELALGRVRKANAQGKLYPKPENALERRCLDFLVRNGALVAVLGSETSLPGYAAVRSPGSIPPPPSDPLRRAQA